MFTSRNRGTTTILSASATLWLAVGCTESAAPLASTSDAGGRDVGVVACLDTPAVPVTPPACEIPASQTGPLHFERCVLDTEYRNEGVGAFDVDGDAYPDIVTDQYWYESPGMTPHEIRTPETWNPFGSYALGFGAYPFDVNGDGCTDVVAPPHATDPFYWYEHPCRCGSSGAEGHWTRHLIADAATVGLENPFLADFFGDGEPVLISSNYGAGTFGFVGPGDDPTAPWPLRPLAPPGFPGAALYQHGVGAGDLDRDGDLDLLSSWGWFENPGNRTAEWRTHIAPNPFVGRDNDCSRMWTYDVNDDGLADVICSRPHGNGLSWLEQAAPAAPSTEPTFVDHFIAGSEIVTQLHALRLADLDGDGVDEIVTGTRWCAHCGYVEPPDGGVLDPDPNTEYLVYYTLDRSGPEPRFDQHVIDTESGVGVAFDIADVDVDGDLDVVTANKHGLFYFRQVP